ncbi:MAG TPA: hypothetical protein VEG65_06860 [Candidatus Bathyarchaeia archaeon]|nr:hypothetical protein [Candidatus Bathyarchaeia archaeon]
MGNGVAVGKGVAVGNGVAVGTNGVGVGINGVGVGKNVGEGDGEGLGVGVGVDDTAIGLGVCLSARTAAAPTTRSAIRTTPMIRSFLLVSGPPNRSSSIGLSSSEGGSYGGA